MSNQFLCNRKFPLTTSLFRNFRVGVERRCFSTNLRKDLCVIIVLLCRDQFYGSADGCDLVGEVKHADSLSDETLRISFDT